MEGRVCSVMTIVGHIGCGRFVHHMVCSSGGRGGRCSEGRGCRFYRMGVVDQELVYVCLVFIGVSVGFDLILSVLDLCGGVLVVVTWVHRVGGGFGMWW